MVCPVHQVHALPAHTTFAQGAALGVPAATAYRALVLRAQVKAGETVLVHGASGAVGNCAVQLARALGLTVIGTAGSDSGLAAVRKAGAAHAFNHHEEGYAKQITELTGGKGVDVVLEMLANVNLDRNLALVASKGRVVVIGSRGRIEIDPRQTMGKESAVLGTTLWSTTPDEYRQIHAGLEGALASHALDPLVGRELPLGHCAGGASRHPAGSSSRQDRPDDVRIRTMKSRREFWPPAPQPRRACWPRARAFAPRDSPRSSRSA